MIIASATFGHSGISQYPKITSSSGGGIANAGQLTVKNSTFANNKAESGGGISNGGSATLRNSTVSNNTAEEGDDIYNEGSLTLRNVTCNECVDDNGGTGCPEP